MDNLSDVELAVHIGDRGNHISVVGSNHDETKGNLLKLFTKKNDRKKTDHPSNNQRHISRN